MAMESSRGWIGCAWQGSGLLYQAMCVAGIVAGLWPEAILPSKTTITPMPLPTLATLAIAQTAFLLLVYPLAIMRRAARSACFNAACTATEMATLLVATVPFYVVAAYLADAVTLDVLRATLGVLTVVPLSLAAAAWLKLGTAWRTWAVMIMLLAVLGLPVVTFVAAEFLIPGWSDILWQFTPTTFLWDNAQPRQASLMPQPYWPAITYLAAAAVMYLLAMLRETHGSKKRINTNNTS